MTEEYMASKDFGGFRLVADGKSTNVLFECSKCSNTLKFPINGASTVVPELAANKAKDQGWKASAWAKSKTVCPSCQIHAKNDPDSELKKVAALMAQTPVPTVTPLREPTVEQRVAIRSSLDKHFDDAQGMYLDNYDDEKIAAHVGVPRAVVERMREAAYGPIRISKEDQERVKLYIELKAELEEIERKQTNARTLLQVIDERIATVRGKIEETLKPKKVA
jgi:hypothetical protein